MLILDELNWIQGANTKNTYQRFFAYKLKFTQDRKKAMTYWKSPFPGASFDVWQVEKGEKTKSLKIFT